MSVLSSSVNSFVRESEPKHYYSFSEFSCTNSHVEFFWAHIKFQFNVGIDVAMKNGCENINNVIAEGEIWVCVEEEPTAGGLMTGDCCRLDPEIVSSELVKIFLFNILDWFAGG